MAFGKALEERGHTVTFFNLLDTESTIKERGLRFIPFGLSVYPEGALKQIYEKIGKLQGPAAFQYFLERMITQADTSFRELPALIEEEEIEALVIDQLFPGGATVAQHLKLPYLSLANALAVNHEASVPPPTLPWAYDATEAGIARNEKGWQQIAQAFIPWRDADNAQRIAWGLQPYNDVLEDSFSPFAQITQQPKFFDLPRSQAPANLHYVGPLNHAATRKQAAFPWEKLNGKPLVYASMGTLQNGLDHIFRTILDACAPLDLQLILSLGGGSLNQDQLGDLPPNAILVPYAPQFDVLAYASLCITHAGLNTALDVLTQGVPMVAIPITNDQPGVAVRIQWTRTGEILPLADLTTERLQVMISQVMGDQQYRANAKAIQRSIAQLSPLTTACEILESKVLSQVASSLSK
jgi:MGT family glycosyltransferase